MDLEKLRKQLEIDEGQMKFTMTILVILLLVSVILLFRVISNMEKALGQGYPKKESENASTKTWNQY